MSSQKFVGRSPAVAVIHPRNPPRNGAQREMDTTMNKHANTCCRAKAPLVRAVFVLACMILPLASITAISVDTSPAYAGSWIEVSCENPNLSAAPSDGWAGFVSGSPGYGSNNSTSCGPGSPMLAILSSDAAAGVGSGENLQYAPPAGSALAGGSVDVSMYGDGYGADASGTAVVYSPEFAYSGADVLLQCSSGQPPCSAGGSPYDYAGVISLPANRGGSFYIGAGCGGSGGQSCDEGGSEGAWALVRVWWANFLLSNTATPAATGVSGTLLSPNARGTQELAFNATDAGGPGVYNTTAQVDGKTFYSGTPDTNGGECVPVGSSGGVLMFDYSQPCRQSESVDIPIDTTSLPDGQHTLKVTVEDAAQNSSVVYDGSITTDNAPANTTAPTIIAPSQVLVGAALSTQPGAWSAPTGAGNIAYGYQWEDCNTEGNNCTPIAGAQSASYTPAPSDVGHTLRVVVNAADSDGLTSTSSAATGVVLSNQASLGAPNGPGTGGTNPSGSPSTSTSTSVSSLTSSTTGVGAANGTFASETAQLHLGSPRIGRRKVTHCSYSHQTISCPYTYRAFTAVGRLLDSQGRPISSATLDILQQVAGSQSSLVIAHTKTRPDGTFEVRVPAGPSRLIDVAYRAFSGDAGYAAQAKIEEQVKAAIQLNITPQDTSPEGTILLTGKVLGPIPSQGVIVELIVYYHRHWEPFRTPRTDAAGEFHAVYQFEGSVGRFPFQAETPEGQAGFPFALGYSKQVHVTSG
jgi:hypothetical protein